MSVAHMRGDPVEAPLSWHLTIRATLMVSRAGEVRVTRHWFIQRPILTLGHIAAGAAAGCLASVSA